MWKHKRPQTAKAILRQKNKAGAITLLVFRLSYKGTEIKTEWYWHKNRHINQWNRIESPEINSHTYGQLIYEKEARLYNGETTVSSISGAGKTKQLHVKQMKLEHCLTPYTEINSKWINDLNVRPDTIIL